jgi:hypothetical protein
MATKAKKKETKPKARKVAIRELSDPRRWRPLPEIHERLYSQLGPSTDFELMEALRNDELRCVHRPANSNQCEEKRGLFWQSHQLYFYGDALKIYAPNPHATTDPRELLDGREFYVEQSEKVWPVLKEAPQATKENEPEEGERGKPGPRPTKEWQWFVAGKYYTEKYNDRQEPTAPELAELCHDRFGYEPKTTAINLLLRKLRKILG